MSNTFQCGFENATGLWSSEVWSAFVTTEREEVKLAGLVEAVQSPKAWGRIFPQLESRL